MFPTIDLEIESLLNSYGFELGIKNVAENALHITYIFIHRDT